MDRKLIVGLCFGFCFYLTNAHPAVLDSVEQHKDFDDYTDVDKFDVQIAGDIARYPFNSEEEEDYISKLEENNEYNNDYNEHFSDDHVDVNYDGSHRDVKRNDHGDFNETEIAETTTVTSLDDEEGQGTATEENQDEATKIEKEEGEDAPGDQRVDEENNQEETIENTTAVQEDETTVAAVEEGAEDKEIKDEDDGNQSLKEEDDETTTDEGESYHEEEEKEVKDEDDGTQSLKEEDNETTIDEGNSHHEEEEKQVKDEEDSTQSLKEEDDETTNDKGDSYHEEGQEKDPSNEETPVVQDDNKDSESSSEDTSSKENNQLSMPFQRSSGKIETHADLTEDDSDVNKNIAYGPETFTMPPFTPHVRIVGGDRVHNRADFAFQASFRFNSNQHFCGASIIDDRNLLTAAHCVYDDNQRLFPARVLRVVVGDLNVQDTTEHTMIRIVRHIFPHPNYNYRTFKNDIAVLRVDSMGSFTDYVNKIELANETPAVGTDCVVSGWGKTASSGFPSLQLMKVNVPILSMEDCRTNYQSSILEGMVCAGLMEGGKDACQGDSGGPLVCENKLVGVVSWGHDCALKNYPGVYTDVATYYDWIREQQGIGRNEGVEGATEFDIEGRKTGLIAQTREGFQYQASLRYKIPNSHFCGATIIDSTHLITAAHCVITEGNLYDPNSLMVVVGDLNILEETDSTEYRSVVAVFVHEKYNNNTFENDIAVIRISKPFEQWTQDIGPIEIGESSPAFYTSCTVSGWGSNSSPASPSEVLRYTSVPVIETRSCFDVYSEAIKPGMLCAGFLQKGKDTCQGDSGSPLVCDDKLSGVVSWGHRCANEGLPGVYTDVALYRSWIETQKTRSSADVSSKFSFYIIILSFAIFKVFSF